MRLEVKDSTLTRTFEYKGENPELLESALARVLSELDQEHSSYEVLLGERGFFASKRAWRQLRQVIRDPQRFIKAESLLASVLADTWDFTEYLQNWKFAVRYVWKYASLKLESDLLHCLEEEGNGGLNVETVWSRLTLKGVQAGFAAIRDGLGHLCKLGFAEHQRGQFSVKYKA